MSTQFTVSNDPARPHGGYARIAAPSSALPQDSVPVSVFDPYSNRYLGRDDFQADPVQFGPYPVERDGETAWVTVGPEIVNQIEEYAKVKLTVGDAVGQVDWPDDVVPAFGAARIGDIFSAKVEEAPSDDANLVGRMPKKPEPPEEPAEPAPVPTPAPPPPPPPVDPKPEPEPEPKQSKALLFGGLGVVLIAAAALAYFLLLAPQDDPEPEPEPEPVATTEEQPPVQPVALAEPEGSCSDDIMLGLADLAFADARQTMATCATRLSPDDALAVLEKAAQAGIADALMAFGKAYDGQATDPEFEDGFGVTFGDAPAQAAEYYKRALDAGAAEAEVLLQAVCDTLSTATGTVESSAHQDWCAE